MDRGIHGDAAFEHGHRSADCRTVDIEMGAHGANRRNATTHDEGTVLVFRHLEKRLPLVEFDTALLLRELNAQSRARVQVDGRAISERNRTPFADVGAIARKALNFPPGGAREDEDKRARGGGENSAARPRGALRPLSWSAAVVGL